LGTIAHYRVTHVGIEEVRRNGRCVHATSLISSAAEAFRS
jgi:hypothetical protein